MKKLRVDNVRTDRNPLCITKEGNVLMRGINTDSASIYLSEDSCVTDTLIATLPATYFLKEVFLATSGTYIALMVYWDTGLGKAQYYVARSTDLITWTQVLVTGDSTFLTHGICDDQYGNIYIGEYNTVGKTTINLWKSIDDGLTFSPVYVFTDSVVRHIHFIQLDPYTNNLWMGCGDTGTQPRIGYSSDGGESWTWVDQGSQRARACGALFTQNYVHWGMDANAETAYMVRYNRVTGEVEKTSPCRYEVMWHHKWNTSGVLMASNAYDVTSTDEQNSYFYLSDNEGADWFPTLGMMPQRILIKSNTMWNWTKQDKNGYMYTYLQIDKVTIRVSLVDVSSVLKTVEVVKPVGVVKPVSAIKRCIRLIDA